MGVVYVCVCVKTGIDNGHQVIADATLFLHSPLPLAPAINVACLSKHDCYGWAFHDVRTRSRRQGQRKRREKEVSLSLADKSRARRRRINYRLLCMGHCLALCSLSRLSASFAADGGSVTRRLPAFICTAIHCCCSIAPLVLNRWLAAQPRPNANAALGPFERRNRLRKSLSACLTA